VSRSTKNYMVHIETNVFEMLILQHHPTKLEV